MDISGIIFCQPFWISQFKTKGGNSVYLIEFLMLENLHFANIFMMIPAVEPKL